jgi:transposase
VNAMVAIRVFAGNTGDPTAFIDAVQIVRHKFALKNMVMVGDRGMITTARIDALREADDAITWLTCLRAPAIAKLAAENGPLQLSLFDTQDLAEITHPDYPGERLIACRNPILRTQRAAKREALLSATEHALAPITTSVKAGRLHGQDAIGLKVGKIINKYKMAKHFTVTITDHRLRVTRDQTKIDAEAALDVLYVIRTPVPADTLDAPGAVSAYKQLAHLERDFRSLKIDDLDLRPSSGRCTTSAACSTTSPPSPATTSSSPTAPTSTSSPQPPTPNAAPSNCSTHPPRPPSRSQNRQPHTPRSPRTTVAPAALPLVTSG